MIYDNLENLGDYLKLAPETFNKIMDFCEDLGAAPDLGRYEIDGEAIFANVQSYNPHLDNPDLYEYHHNYADIQLLLAGNETIMMSDSGAEVKPYDAAKDIGFDHLGASGAAALPLRVGNFLLIMPNERHQPGVGDPESTVIKVVIKVAKKLF